MMRVFVAAAAVLVAQHHAEALSAAEREIFEFMPVNRIYGACLASVREASAASSSRQGPTTAAEFETSCLKAFGDAVPTNPAPEDTSHPHQHRLALRVAQRAEELRAPLADACAEFSGRAAEADEQGYLGGGAELCAQTVREEADAANQPIAVYFPAEADSPDAAAFCDVLNSQVPKPCASLLDAQNIAATEAKQQLRTNKSDKVSSASSQSSAVSLWARIKTAIHLAA